jgi:hypothetical protein
VETAGFADARRLYDFVAAAVAPRAAEARVTTAVAGRSGADDPFVGVLHAPREVAYLARAAALCHARRKDAEVLLSHTSGCELTIVADSVDEAAALLRWLSERIGGHGRG